jgi:aryl-alcohol dehydrogenase-like predicted oxidoreductase
MIPRVRLGRTGLDVSRIGLGCFPFGAVNKARGWDPYTPEGRKTAIATIHTALDAGINYLDTAPGYGNGQSESIVGEALEGRRDKCVLASKVGYHGLSAAEVTASVEASLQRLRTDCIDVIQFHGGMFEQSEVDHILNGGPLEALVKLRDKGSIRFIGFTAEEPWTARPLIASKAFDVVQLCYNLIYQGAALHALKDTTAADMGVAVMRPMTSGIFQRIAAAIAPEWQQAHDLYDASLRFVLSDNRVHVANIGMRWSHEIAHNIRIAESLEHAPNMAEVPRMTISVYQAEDAG